MKMPSESDEILSEKAYFQKLLRPLALVAVLRPKMPARTLIQLFILIIIHSNHYLFSDWPKAYSEFSKSAPGTSSTCRLYNNHVKDTQGHG